MPVCYHWCGSRACLEGAYWGDCSVLSITLPNSKILNFYFSVAEESEFANARNTPMSSLFSGDVSDNEKKKGKKKDKKDGGILGLFR